MKTRAEVDVLKRDWEKDPCWDIETSEGFEEHQDELKIFRLNCEFQWKRKKELHETKLRNKICPVKMMNNSFVSWNCEIGLCAWWNGTSEKCAITGVLKHDENR